MGHRRLNEAALALGFLTRLPLGRDLAPLPRLADAAWAFPLAGLVAALPGALILWALPGALGAILAIGATIWLTGGLHEDGLADLADGMGARDPARRLEVMRDSRIGSFGVLALGLVTALRIAALAGTDMAPLALIAVAMASRAGIAAAMRLPPARASGLGAGAGRPALRVLAGAAGLAAVAALLLLGVAAALCMLAAVALAQAWLAARAMRRLGGQTGDVLGALQQVGEAAGLVALAVLSA